VDQNSVEFSHLVDPFGLLSLSVGCSYYSSCTPFIEEEGEEEAWREKYDGCIASGADLEKYSWGGKRGTGDFEGWHPLAEVYSMPI
jgi:hypothetical protein